ncbi:transglutaminase-like cysteine peptidase (plasmid) [Martelella lutilitoris]|jgi:predicted transglutaminase-like cysteine proteinase|uniref:Transglutaminase-like cysteine peptidase n=1 Tax=Martelella lutilitoris TaxID=2583532 RepID=A0A7T7KNQ7_9HYPH|nr:MULTISPECIES: transglutaminase-like cysteine peptidase [Martelella]AMM87384.1 transglutaminase [Martelella sp. AD-3]QQM33050.1 transglutaminase-like cysteine peptidase [Martelella lutilitoris]QRX65203.1 transglutaminase-like cysteine peptidase [Dysgonomonadaceae bacterium zrk40]
MGKSVIAALALALSCGAAGANALHLNQTQPTSVANMVTFGRTTIPIGYYDYCQRYADRCDRPADGQIVELTRELWSDIIQTNDDVNTSVAPLTDNEIFGVEERWEYPKNVGDCEDYALEKRKRLNQRGIPLGALSMTVGRDANGGGHAVLTVITDRGDFVLDNVEPRVLLWKETELYFLKRQSQHDPNTWVSLVSG